MGGIEGLAVTGVLRCHLHDPADATRPVAVLLWWLIGPHLSDDIAHD